MSPAIAVEATLRPVGQDRLTVTPLDLTATLVDTARMLSQTQTALAERNVKLAGERAIILRAEMEEGSSVAAAERTVEMMLSSTLGDLEREKGKIASLTTRRDLLLALMQTDPSTYLAIQLDDLPPL
jgi:hypothetical protein